MDSSKININDKVAVKARIDELKKVIRNPAKRKEAGIFPFMELGYFLQNLDLNDKKLNMV